MQAWHCIAIITISVILFIYGTFRNEIEDHVYEQKVEKIMETISVSPEQKNTALQTEAEILEKSIVDSPAWAKFEIILKCQSLEMAALHAQALKGNFEVKEESASKRVTEFMNRKLNFFSSRSLYNF